MPRQLSEATGPTAVFRLVTYNVDGLRDQSSSVEGAHRTCIAAMAASVLAAAADVVCLQEVTPQSIVLFNLRLCNSQFQPPSMVPSSQSYFTVTYVSIKHTILHSAREPFSTRGAQSQMGRDVLLTTIAFCGSTVNVLNTHLESGAEVSSVRKSQLKEAIEAAAAVPGLTILCGDMNLRAPEWTAISAACEDTVDLYEAAGTKGRGAVPNFTWQRCFPGKSAPISSRFDRVLLRASQDVFVSEASYAVIGSDRIEAAECSDWGYVTPSDHLGIVATLHMPERTTEPAGVSREQPKQNVGTAREMAAKAALARASTITGTTCTSNHSLTTGGIALAKPTCDATHVDLTGEECDSSSAGAEEEDGDLARAIALSMGSQANGFKDRSKKRKHPDVEA